MNIFRTLALASLLFAVCVIDSHAQRADANYPSSYSKPITSIRCNQFTFDATGSYDTDNGNITYHWDFGDGSSSDQPIAEHTYEKSGEYDVELSVTDNSGLACSVAKSTQRVLVNLPPFATFSGAGNVCIGQPIILDASGSYDETARNLGFEWNFGDGSVETNKARVSKVYNKGGDYKVSLKVDDQSGTVCDTHTFQDTVHVNAPPIAEAGPEEMLKCVSDNKDLIANFDASNSYDNNKDQLSFIWDFGDGHRGQGRKISHQYTQVGNYDVRLIVDDNTNLGCGSNVDFISVRLNEAPRADAGDDVIACIGDTITFDGSQSYAEKRGTLSAVWSFGDGQSVRTLKTTHNYVKPGKYQATLTVKNELNESCAPSKDTKLVNINSLPTVSIKTSRTACLGDKVQFDASSANDPDGDPLEYYWSFGDGTIVKGGPKTTHEFRQGGRYRVTVVVDDSRGTSCSTATADTSILINTPPIADAGPNLSCCTEKLTNFDGSASSDPDGDELTYTWDFGDGSGSNGALTNHIYNKSGSYNVVLKVDDNSGTSCSVSTSGFTASVNTSPVPIITVR